ncbi:hypothetical protein CEXT_496481 [Caerostris extrusa]|uniref:Uncharacterized protein n=1 Tax=Caerostris extrusa TaxID=172846 RepID=A0AAV4XWQ8_CAEEX|nr:hypothetical protein CEXT_496481 [Caerostris extrusa]
MRDGVHLHCRTRYPYWSTPELAQVFGVRGPPTFEMGEITLRAFWDGGVIQKRFHRGSTESFIVFPHRKGRSLTC